MILVLELYFYKHNNYLPRLVVNFYSVAVRPIDNMTKLVVISLATDSQIYEKQISDMLSL